MDLTTSDKDLNELMNDEKNYKGCFTLDDLKTIKNGVSFIFLIDKRKKIGHWCFILKRKNDSIWFDPFGSMPPDKILSLNKNKIYMNNTKIQNWKSHACGIWCVIIYKLIKNKSLKQINNFLESKQIDKIERSLDKLEKTKHEDKKITYTKDDLCRINHH
jgi:hypothetical protein